MVACRTGAGEAARPVRGAPQACRERGVKRLDRLYAWLEPLRLQPLQKKQDPVSGSHLKSICCVASYFVLLPL